MTHSPLPIGRRSRLRQRLAMTTALAGFLVAAPAWGQAQVATSGPGQVKSTTPGSVLGGSPGIDLDGEALKVTLHANNTIINWDGFNVSQKGSAKFTDAVINGNQPIAVLNRDVSGKASQILGQLSSDATVAVWILNPNGIMIGSKANINTGSLVLSTLEIADKDFLEGNGSYTLKVKDAATSMSAITVGEGARINVQGSNRGLVMVAPKIDAFGEFDAHDQDVAFVTASDVEFTFSSNSPLSVKINSGTAVSGRSQFVRGTVDGADAIFALASQGSVTDALLQVDAKVTTATSGTRGIVLSAGRVGTPIDGVDVAGGAANTNGGADLMIGGSLTTTDNDGSDILAGAIGKATFTGALTSRRDIRIAGGGDVTVAGAVDAGGDYLVDGYNVTLGKVSTNGTDDILQQADGAVGISANRTLTGLGALTLLANADGSDQKPEALTLSSNFAGVDAAPDGTTPRVPGGTINFAPGTTLKGGNDRESSVLIRSGAADGAVSLGNVAARDLLGAVGTESSTVGIARQTALTVGDVSLRGQVKLDGTALTTGALTSINDAVTLTSSTGDITTGKIDAAKAIRIDSAVALTTGAIDGDDAVTFNAVGAATVNGYLSADGNLSIRAASIALDGKADSRGALDLTSTSGPIATRELHSSEAMMITGAGSLFTGGIDSDAGLSIEASGDARFGGKVEAQGDLRIGAASFELTDKTSAGGTLVLTSTSGAITAKGIESSKSATITSAGALTTGGVTSGGALSVEAAGAATFGGDVTSQDDLAVRAASIDAKGWTSSDGAIDLSTGSGAIGARDLQAGKAVTITSGALQTGAIGSGAAITVNVAGDAKFGGNLTAGGDLVLRAGALRFDGQEAKSGGTIDLRANVGGISSGAEFALTSTSSDATDFIRLQATGAQGIDLTQSGRITAGSNQALRVTVRNETDGAALVLGDVTARALVGLSVADGDPVTQGGPITSSASLTFGNLQLVDGFSASSTGGDLRVASIAVTGAGQGISLSAPVGTLAVQSTLRASGDVTLLGGTSIGVGAVESTTGTASVTSAGSVTLGTLAGARSVSASGASVNIGTVRGGGIDLATTAGGLTLGGVSGGRVILNAVGGDIAVNGAVSSTGAVSAVGTDAVRFAQAVNATGGGVRVRAGAGEAALLGGVTAAGDYSVSGQSVTLGGRQEAIGGVSINSTGGAIVGQPMLVLASDTDGVGADPLALSATGGAIALAIDSFLSGGRDAGSAVTVTTDAGAVALGGVSARSLTIAGATQPIATITAGNLSLSDALSATAANGVTTGTIDVTQGGVTLEGGAGSVQTGNIAAAGAVSLTGGSLAYGAIGGNGVTMTASTGNVVGGDIGSTGGIDLTAAAGTITTGRLTASGPGGNVTLASGGRLFATSVTADGTASLTAANPGADVLLAEGLTANGAVNVAAGRDIRAPFIRSLTGSLTVAAPNGDVTYYQPGSRPDLSAGTGQAFSLTVGRAADLGNVQGGPISITASSITAGSINAGSNAISLAATKGDLTVTGDVVAGDTSLTATGMTSLKSVRSTGLLTLSGGTGLRFTNVSGSNVIASSDGLIEGTNATSTGSLTVTGGSLSLGRADAGGALSLTATSGNANLGTLSAGGPLTVTAANDATVDGDIDAGGSAVGLAATKGNLMVAGGIVAGDVNVTAGGLTSLNTVRSSGALTLSGGTGLRFVDLTGASLTASSGGAIEGGSAAATGALNMTGNSLSITRASAGGPLGLTATGGDATLGTLSAGGDLTIQAAGRAAVNGDVDAGAGYSVTGASVVLGDHAVTQQAAGTIAIVAKSGDINGAAGLTLANAGGAAKPAIILDSAGAIALAGTTLRTGGALGLRAGGGRSVALGQIEAGTIGGFEGIATGGTFMHSGSVTTGDITTGGIDVALSSGDLTTGMIDATGAVRLAATAGGVTTRSLRGASLDLAAGGILSATSLDTPGSATLAGGEIRVDAVRAGSIGVRTTSALGGNAGGRASLTSTVGDTVVDAGDMRIGTIDSAGALSLTGGAIDAAGKLSASRALLIKARAALTMADGSAGGDITLGADGAISAGALAAGGALSVTSGADVGLGSGQAAGAATIDAAGLAKLGALSAGPSIMIRAADAELTGTQRAATITFQNSAATLSAMRLGDATGAGGFRLSNVEVALVNADAVRFDQGAGALQVGALSFGADTGRRTVDLLTTGAISVDGIVTGAGLGRAFRFGGDAASGAASDLRVTTTSDGGGRLLFNDANLDLRANRIAVGLAPGFLDRLAPGEAGRAQALALISDGNSSLYNAGLGGGFYDPSATTTISAHTLNVRFTDFALFQNTGVPGRFSGAVLGGTLAAPVMPALRVTATGVPGNAGFAMFGTINGAGDASAALLGAGVIDIDPALLPTSRINGCLAGSGTGCLTTIVIQPVLQIFDWSSEDVFGIAQNVSTAFDPGVGGNNEELLTGLPALAPDQQPSVESPKP